MKRIFLDHAAGLKNPNSLHAEGRKARTTLETCRQTLATYINAASPSQIQFAPSASLANYFLLNQFNHILPSAIEHQSILNHPNIKTVLSVDATGRVLSDLPNLFSEDFSPAKTTTYIPDATDKVAVAAGRLQSLPTRQRMTSSASSGSDEKTICISDHQSFQKLVSIALANHEIGTIQDIKQLVQLAHEHGLKFHTDASAAFTKIPIDVQALNIDYLTLSGAKLGIPGIAALYTKTPLHLAYTTPFGTPNIPAISALNKFLKQRPNLPLAYTSSTRPLRNHLWSRLNTEIPNTTRNGHPKNSLPNLLNLSFAGAEGEAILAMCDLSGISIATGSACALGAPSHVIQAITGDPVASHNSIRISLSPTTTIQEIDTVADKLKQIITKLREYTTL